ncbi:MAG: hypothetical protein WBH55_13965 [Bacteroidota bacterium]
MRPALALKTVEVVTDAVVVVVVVGDAHGKRHSDIEVLRSQVWRGGVEGRPTDGKSDVRGETLRIYLSSTVPKGSPPWIKAQ